MLKLRSLSKIILFYVFKRYFMRFGQFQISTEFFFGYAFLNFGKILMVIIFE